MVPVLWIALLAAAAPPGAEAVAASGPASASQEELSPAAQAHALRQEVTALLRHEATTSGPENRAAIRALVGLAHRLEADTALSSTERARLRGIVRSRLARVAKRIQRDQQQEEPSLAADTPDQPATISLGGRPATPAATEAPQAVLGQRLNGAGQPGQGAGAAERGQRFLETLKQVIRPETWDDVGGPGHAVLFQRLGAAVAPQRAAPGMIGGANGAGRGGQAADDRGDELVELIQTVIAPASWDINGGPGSAVYFRPLRVLVVRQTSEIHHDLGGVLGQLRDAGN